MVALLTGMGDKSFTISMINNKLKLMEDDTEVTSRLFSPCNNKTKVDRQLMKTKVDYQIKGQTTGNIGGQRISIYNQINLTVCSGGSWHVAWRRHILTGFLLFSFVC